MCDIYVPIIIDKYYNISKWRIIILQEALLVA